MLKYGGFSVFLNLFIFLTSCAGNLTETNTEYEYRPGDQIIHGVPFIKQIENLCGPASLAAVMKYYGDDIRQEEIAEYVYTSELDGSLVSDMRHYAQERGYDSYTKNSDLKELLAAIDNRKPAILLVDRGTWKVSIPHYYVVYGYNDNDKNFIINDGLHEARRISFTNLESQWGRMNNIMLIVTK